MSRTGSGREQFVSRRVMMRTVFSMDQFQDQLSDRGGCRWRSWHLAE